MKYLLPLLSLTPLLVIGCGGDNTKPNEPPHAMAGLWLAEPDEGELEENDIDQFILSIDEAGFITSYDCHFLAYELDDIAPIELDSNNSFIPPDEDDGYVSSDSIQLSRNNDTLTSVAISAPDEMGEELGEEPDTYTVNYNLISEIPDTCDSGQFDFEVTQLSTDTVSASMDTTVTIDYRYRALKDNPSIIQFDIYGVKGDSDNRLEGIDDIIDNSAVVSGDIIEGQFDLVMKANIIATADIESIRIFTIVQEGDGPYGVSDEATEIIRLKVTP